MLLRARIVVPVSRPPIDDGAVAVSAGRVAWAGRWKDRPAMAGVEVQDFGESALLPGLVNAHCHLDYTGMAGLLPPPKHFTDWIKAIVALKASWTIEDFAVSWRRGARMLLETGTTTVADVEAVPELLPAAWGATPLRVITFRELISLRSREAARELVERCVNDCLKGQRDMSDCGQGSPVQHPERCGYLDTNVLAVHANHLDRRDASLLAANGVSVVHCPRSHDYFRHLKFPRQELESAGVNVCLGTDSLASVRKESGRAPKLSLFAEMQSLARAAPGLAAEAILRMATVNGARALGRAGAIGEISRGAAADLIALPIGGASGDVFEAVIHHAG